MNFEVITVSTVSQTRTGQTPLESLYVQHPEHVHFLQTEHRTEPGMQGTGLRRDHLVDTGFW